MAPEKYSIDGEEVYVTKEKDDPIAIRVSVGGRPSLGYYAVYRGSIKQAIEVMETCLKALKEHENR